MRADHEQQIRALLEARTRAFAARDAGPAASPYSDDLVLFDAAPLLASDDTAAFLDFVDAAILVAAAEETSIDEVDLAESEVAASTNVLGVVLNKSRYSSSTHGYEEGYY